MTKFNLNKPLLYPAGQYTTLKVLVIATVSVAGAFAALTVGPTILAEHGNKMAQVYVDYSLADPILKAWGQADAEFRQSGGKSSVTVESDRPSNKGLPRVRVTITPIQ